MGVIRLTGPDNTAELAIADGTITTAMIANNSVTPPKLNPPSFYRYFAVMGRNGAGALAVPELVVNPNWLVVTVTASDAGGAGGGTDVTNQFENTPSVANQLQQSSATDFTGFVMHITVAIIAL